MIKIKQFIRAIRPKRCCLKKIYKLKILFTKRYLVFTNTGLCILTSVLGDLLKQTYQGVINGQELFWDAGNSAKMATVGLVLGPTIHSWYLFLDNILPGKTKRTVLIKVLMDAVIFSPISISLFLLIVGVLEQQGIEGFFEDFKKIGLLMFITDLIVWTPVQIINFYYVPPRFRVLYDNCISLLNSMLYSYLRFD